MVPKKLKGLAATKLFRRIAVELRWCDNCNIPLVSSRRCSLCGELARDVKLVPPGDVRLAFDYDLELLRKSIEDCLSPRAASILAPLSGFVLLNKVQSFDVAYEVVVDGYSIGLMYFEPLSKKWMFRPMYYGAKIAVEEGLSGYLVVRNPIPGKIVGREDVAIEGEIPERFVVVVSSDRQLVGLAKRVSKGFAIVKVWRVKEVPKLGKRSSSLKRAIDGNDARLRRLERAARDRIAKALRMGKPFVTVSGGKDSSIVAYIASSMGVKDFVFVDTGLELPETYKVIDMLEKALDIYIERIGDPKAFWREVEVLGPPARDYRWCSRVCKLVHLSKWCHERGCNISLVGQRRYESVSRALAGPISVSGSGARGMVVAPIHEWSALEVMLFAIDRGIPLNELYTKGFDRVGCFMCPTSRLAEFEHVRRVHAESWNLWVEVLERWRRRWGLPREWIDLGLWRWRYSYPAEARHIASTRGVDVKKVVVNILGSYALMSLGRMDGSYLIKVFVKDFEASLHRLRGALIAVGFNNIDVHGDEIEFRGNGFEAKVDKHAIELVVDEKLRKDKIIKLLRRIVKAWFFSASCSYCGLCESVCHKGAVRRGVIDVGKCSSCARCVFVCPRAMIGDHVVNMVIEELRAIP